MLKKFIHLIKTCFFFFEKKEKINFLFLSVYLLISGVFEVLNLLMIGIFLKAVSNPNYAVESFSLNNIFFFLDFNESNVQLYLAVALCISLIVSSFFNLLINWKTYNYICDVSTKISRKIFFYYYKYE